MVKNLLIAFVLSSLMLSANAGLILTDLGDDTYQVELSPLTFTVDKSGLGNRITIEDFYTTNFSGGTGKALSGNLNYQINNGSIFQLSFESNNGVWKGTEGQQDPNDLLFNFTIDYRAKNVGELLVGDEIRVWTNNMVFLAANDDTKRITSAQPWTAYLLNGLNPIASTAVSKNDIPEPSVLALFFIAILLLIPKKRRM